MHGNSNIKFNDFPLNTRSLLVFIVIKQCVFFVVKLKPNFNVLLRQLGSGLMHGLDVSVFKTPVGEEEIFLFSTRVQTGPGAHPASFLGVKRPGLGVKHSAPSSALCVSTGLFRGDFYITQKQIISVKKLFNSVGKQQIID